MTQVCMTWQDSEPLPVTAQDKAESQMTWTHQCEQWTCGMLMRSPNFEHPRTEIRFLEWSPQDTAPLADLLDLQLTDPMCLSVGCNIAILLGECN